MDYKTYHEELTDCYYSGKPFEGELLTKEMFELLHSLNWLKLEAEQIGEGKGERALSEVSAQINETELAIEKLKK